MCCSGGDGDDDDEGTVSRPQRNVPIPGQPSQPGPTTPVPQPGPSGGGFPTVRPGSPNPAPFYPGSPFVRTDGDIIGTDGTKRRIRRLYCDTGFDLAVFPNGKVAGVKSAKNKYGNLEIESVGLDGEVKIKGVNTGFYVTMTPKGRVRAQPSSTAPGTVWVETRIGQRVGYMSLLSLDYAHKGWYLAVKKSGKIKPGPKTNHPYPQRAISFLPRIVGEVSVD